MCGIYPVIATFIPGYLSLLLEKKADFAKKPAAPQKLVPSNLEILKKK